MGSTRWHHQAEAAGWQQPEAPSTDADARVPTRAAVLGGLGLPGAQTQDAEAIAKDSLIPAPLLLLLIHVSPNNTTKEALSI